MKILHINSYYVKDVFYTNLFNYQIESGIDIDVLVHKAKNTFNNFNKENCIVLSSYNKIDKYFFYLKHKKLYNDVKRIDLEYDLVHAHTLFTNGYQAYKIYKQFRIDYVVAIRSTDLDVFFKYFIHLRKTGLNILLNAKKIIFISEGYKTKLFKYINVKYHDEILKKSIVIPNGISNFFLENKGSNSNELNKIKILHVARINKNKNAILIVKAIEILLRQGYDISLDCIGSVEEEDVLHKLLGYDFVSHYSFMSKEKLINFYKKSTMFIMTSFNETYGISYLEAMSQGLPVIYTRDEGFDNQFPDGYVGYNCDSSDAVELSNKIKDVLNNYENIKSNCINSVDEFDWKIIGEKYTNIYNDILNKR